MRAHSPPACISGERKSETLPQAPGRPPAGDPRGLRQRDIKCWPAASQQEGSGRAGETRPAQARPQPSGRRWPHADGMCSVQRPQSGPCCLVPDVQGPPRGPGEPPFRSSGLARARKLREAPREAQNDSPKWSRLSQCQAVWPAGRGVRHVPGLSGRLPPAPGQACTGSKVPATKRTGPQAQGWHSGGFSQ